MSRKGRMQNLQEMKDARMKKIAIGGAVLLVAVLAYEVPKVMHRGGATSSPPPAATTTTPGTAPTTPAVNATPTASPTASTKLTNSDMEPNRAKGQLYSFSHFTGKDPFVQQVNDTTAVQPNTAAQTSSGSPAPTSAPSPSSNTTATMSATKTSSVRTLASTRAVKIQVNGKVETVRVGKSFPSSNPLFRLVSVNQGSVSIGIASGSYTSGAQTISLTQGRTLTLVDTADGVRYRIRLLSAA